MNFPFIGPVPAYTNVPIEPQYYQPSRFTISDIILGATTLVTLIDAVYPFATVTPNYVVGQLIRFVIPPGVGCRQLNEVSAYVISLVSANQVEIGLDSNGFDAFISNSLPNQPQMLAVGDINMGAINNAGITTISTSIPGSFINISPL